MPEKQPMIDPAVKFFIMDIFPDERTFEMLVQVARNPGHVIDYYEESHHFEDESDIKDSAEFLEKKELIRQKEGGYYLTDFAKNRYSELLSKLYPECHKCSYESLLGIHDIYQSHCRFPGHETGNDRKIQLTGCTDFKGISR